MSKRAGDKALVTFTGGLWSPRLIGRTDLEKANAALRQCDNFIVRPSGAIKRRPGMQLIAAARIAEPGSGSGSGSGSGESEPAFLLFQTQVAYEPLVPLNDQVFL